MRQRVEGARATALACPELAWQRRSSGQGVHEHHGLRILPRARRQPQNASLPPRDDAVPKPVKSRACLSWRKTKQFDAPRSLVTPFEENCSSKAVCRQEHAAAMRNTALGVPRLHGNRHTSQCLARFVLEFNRKLRPDMWRASEIAKQFGAYRKGLTPSFIDVCQLNRACRSKRHVVLDCAEEIARH